MAANMPEQTKEDGMDSEDHKCQMHEAFTELNEMKELIKNLEVIWQDSIAMERSAERFRCKRLDLI